MNSLRSDYKSADGAISNLVRLIVLIATVASAYAVFHFNVSEFQYEMARRRVLINSLFLLEKIKDQNTMRIAGPRELVDHLLGDFKPSEDHPASQGVLEKYTNEIEDALGADKAILTEFPLFYSTDLCSIALWRIPNDASLPGHRRDTTRFAVLPGAFCSKVTHALLPAALEFSSDGKPVSILLTKPLRNLFPTFSVFGDCAFQGDCTTIPALLPNDSSLAKGYPFVRGLGDSRLGMALPIELAGVYATSYLPHELKFEHFLDAKAGLENEIRKQSPAGSQRFLGLEFKGSLVVPFVALAALTGLAILLIASIFNLRRTPALTMSAPSLLVDPGGFIPKLARVSIAMGPAVSALLVVLCVQDHLRRPFVIPVIGDQVYVNPLRWHYFSVGDPLLHDTRLFEVNAGTVETYYVVLLILAFAAITTSSLASLFLMSLSVSSASRVKKKLSFSARRRALLRGVIRSKPRGGTRPSR